VSTHILHLKAAAFFNAHNSVEVQKIRSTRW